MRSYLRKPGSLRKFIPCYVRLSQYNDTQQAKSQCCGNRHACLQGKFLIVAVVVQGNADSTWSVALPAEEVPPELPEPCLGLLELLTSVARVHHATTRSVSTISGQRRHQLCARRYEQARLAGTGCCAFRCLVDFCSVLLWRQARCKRQVS